MSRETASVVQANYMRDLSKIDNQPEAEAYKVQRGKIHAENGIYLAVQSNATCDKSISKKN